MRINWLKPSINIIRNKKSNLWPKRRINQRILLIHLLMIRISLMSKTRRRQKRKNKVKRR